MSDSAAEELAGLRRVLNEALSDAPDSMVAPGAVELREKFLMVARRNLWVAAPRSAPLAQPTADKQREDT